MVKIPCVDRLVLCISLPRLHFHIKILLPRHCSQYLKSKDIECKNEKDNWKYLQLKCHSSNWTSSSFSSCMEIMNTP